ncbi:ferredoxin-type protein NapF [Rhizobium daejeonense]
MPQTTSTRRGFLAGRALGGDKTPYPPGITEESLKDCSGCGECATACPSKIISIRHGIPVLDFQRGECTFCGKCADRCPERVFPTEPTSNFPHNAVIADACLAMNFVDCQACRDVCAPAAIRFSPRIGGPFVPVLDANACTGCGACISVCPSQAISTTPRVFREIANA